MAADPTISKKIAPASRGRKKGWPTVAGQVPPQTAELLAHLESQRHVQRTDLIHEAVVALLRSYGYRPEVAA